MSTSKQPSFEEALAELRIVVSSTLESLPAPSEGAGPGLCRGFQKHETFMAETLRPALVALGKLKPES